MRGYLSLLIAVCLLAVLGAGAATALPSEETSIGNETETNETDVGICVVGADSPCNGDDVDESGSTDQSGDGEMGVCVVGAGGPCNGEDTAPDDSTADSTDGVSIGDGTGDESESDGGGDVGICVVGAGGPCNDAGAGESERIGTGVSDDQPGGAAGPVWTQQRSRNPFADLFSLLWSVLPTL